MSVQFRGDRGVNVLEQLLATLGAVAAVGRGDACVALRTSSEHPRAVVGAVAFLRSNWQFPLALGAEQVSKGLYISHNRMVGEGWLGCG